MPRIAEKEWTPWVGERLALAWNTALDIIVAKQDFNGEPVDWSDVVPAMVATGITEKTATNILYRAQAAKVLLRRGLYDADKGRTHPIFLNRASEVIDDWMESPTAEGKRSYAERKAARQRRFGGDPESRRDAAS